MISKTLTYANYKNERKTGTFWFHLKPGSLVLLNARATDMGYEDFKDMMQRFIKENQGVKAYEVIEALMVESYGVMSEDGEYFDQSPEVREKFRQSAVKDALVTDIFTDTDRATEFFNALIPVDLMKEALAKAEAKADENTKSENKPANITAIPNK